MLNPTPDRRRFLRATTAAAGAALSLTADSYARVAGANDRLGVAFLGCGARAQAHIHLVSQFARNGLSVMPVGVCDVWDGLEDEYEQPFGGTTVKRKYAQGLYPSAVKCGLDPTDSARVVKDYRRLLDRADVDVVCIATPDHWHARMTIDAVNSGKDAYVETPMVRTPAEAVAVADAVARTGRIVAVGVQSLSDPSVKIVRENLQNGAIGPLVQFQGGAFRNDSRGQWRFYRVATAMNPKTVDWPMFLGSGFDVGGVRIGPKSEQFPFDRTTFAQWRCSTAFSSGPYSDLLVPLVAKFMSATGLRYPVRVIGSGGLFHEHDGRDIPDTATVCAEYAEGCQMLVTATTASNYPIEEVIRGRRGSIRFAKDGLQLFRDEPSKASAFPARLDRVLEATETIAVESPKNETEALWRDFIGCVQTRNANPICPPDVGAAAAIVASMGWESSRLGLALTWDAVRREVRPAPSGMLRFPRTGA